jgi:hypothetical protein
MSHLAPCPACDRHVDVAEIACPFCAAALPPSFRGQQPPAPPRGRLGRAALMAAGATLLGAAACGSDAITSDAAADRLPVSHDAARDFVAVPAYGAPVTTGTGGTPGSGGTTGAGGTTARDASEDRSVVAIYGAAVPADPERS